MPFRLIAALSCGGILMLAVSTAFAGSPGTHSKSTKTKMHKSADVIEWREAGDPQTVVKGAGVPTKSGHVRGRDPVNKNAVK